MIFQAVRTFIHARSDTIARTDYEKSPKFKERATDVTSSHTIYCDTRFDNSNREVVLQFIAFYYFRIDTADFKAN